MFANVIHRFVDDHVRIYSVHSLSDEILHFVDGLAGGHSKNHEIHPRVLPVPCKHARNLNGRETRWKVVCLRNLMLFAKRRPRKYRKGTEESTDRSWEYRGEV